MKGQKEAAGRQAGLYSRVAPFLQIEDPCLPLPSLSEITFLNSRDGSGPTLLGASAPKSKIALTRACVRRLRLPPPSLPLSSFQRAKLNSRA